MAFEMNYSDLSQSELIPEGEYECVIENAMETATDRGTPYLSIRCRVRRDVRQEQQGRIIFHDLWMKRNPEPQDATAPNRSWPCPEPPVWPRGPVSTASPTGATR